MTFTRIATLSAPVATFMGLSLACGLGGPSDKLLEKTCRADGRLSFIKQKLEEAGTTWDDEAAVEAANAQFGLAWDLSAVQNPQMLEQCKDRTRQVLPAGSLPCFADASTPDAWEACGGDASFARPAAPPNPFAVFGELPDGTEAPPFADIQAMGDAGEPCPAGTEFKGGPLPNGDLDAHCEKPDGTKHGPWMTFHGRSKRLGMHTTVVDGQIQGAWTTWSSRGPQKKSQATYVDNEQVGLAVQWNDDGSIYRASRWDGELHGLDVTLTDRGMWMVKCYQRGEQVWSEVSREAGEAEALSRRSCP